jgi:hypothetical protein
MGGVLGVEELTTQQWLQSEADLDMAARQGARNRVWKFVKLLKEQMKGETDDVDGGGGGSGGRGGDRGDGGDSGGDAGGSGGKKLDSALVDRLTYDLIEVMSYTGEERREIVEQELTSGIRDAEHFDPAVEEYFAATFTRGPTRNNERRGSIRRSPSNIPGENSEGSGGRGRGTSSPGSATSPVPGLLSDASKGAKHVSPTTIRPTALSDALKSDIVEAQRRILSGPRAELVLANIDDWDFDLFSALQQLDICKHGNPTNGPIRVFGEALFDQHNLIDALELDRDRFTSFLRYVCRMHAYVCICVPPWRACMGGSAGVRGGGRRRAGCVHPRFFASLACSVLDGACYWLQGVVCCHYSNCFDAAFCRRIPTQNVPLSLSLFSYPPPPPPSTNPRPPSSPCRPLRKVRSIYHTSTTRTTTVSTRST